MTDTMETRAADTRTTRARATGKRLLLLAGVALITFIIGAGWQYMRAERIEDTLARTDRQLAFARLEARLGAATLEAQRGSYGVARSLSSDFYNGLQRHIESTPDAARRHFTEVLDRRDDVIGGLSASDPNTARLLADLFLQWRSGMAELMRIEGWSDTAADTPEPSADGP